MVDECFSKNLRRYIDLQKPIIVLILEIFIIAKYIYIYIYIYINIYKVGNRELS